MPNDDNDKDEKVSKAELDKISAENDKLKEELEDLRLETVTPEYLEFLEAKEKGQKKEDKPDDKPKDDLSKLTPEQIYNKAIKDIEARMDSKFSEREKLSKEAADREKQNIVNNFAKEHKDFETYRPIMYGLSLEHPDWGIQKLYDESKSHVKKLASESDDKNTNKRAGNEKPGGKGSSSFDQNKKYSPAEAAEESWNEVVGGQLTFEE